MARDTDIQNVQWTRGEVALPKLSYRVLSTFMTLGCVRGGQGWSGRSGVPSASCKSLQIVSFERFELASVSPLEKILAERGKLWQVLPS